MNANTVFFGRGASEQGRAENALRKVRQAQTVRKERKVDWREVAAKQ